MHRGGHTGDVVVWFGGDEFVAAAFHHHANQAHWHAVNCLLRLGGMTVDGAASLVIGCVEWWRTIESTIALLYLVAVRESERGLRPHLDRLNSSSKPNAMTKWSKVVAWNSDQNIGDAPKAPSQLTGRMSELRDFRNAFEHSSWGGDRSREHSRLSPVPSRANELDLMEALAICIQFFGYVRSVVPSADLMPEVIIPSGPTFFFVDLEEAAQDLLVPLFRGALDSRGVATDFDLYEPVEPASWRTQTDFRILMRHADEHPLPDVANAWNPMATLEAYGDEHPRRPSDEEFGLPSY